MSERAKEIAKRLVRVVYLVIASAVWVITIGGCLHRRRCVILCYHGVRRSQQKRFEQQMRHIASRVIPLDLTNSRDWTQRAASVVLTFDDAFENLHDHALPVLRRLQLSATVFAVSDNLGRVPAWDIHAYHPESAEFCMSVDSLRRAASIEGIRIGSHTRTHPRLSSINDASLHSELQQSRDFLESVLDQPITDLALPHGDYDDRVLSAASHAGYTRILTLEHDCASVDTLKGVLGRFSMSPDASWLEFRLTVDGAYAWLGRLRRLVRGRTKRVGIFGDVGLNVASATGARTSVARHK